jgi:WD40 repeat protein
VKPVEDAGTSERECPFVCIWDTRSCEEVCRITHGETDRAVVCVGWSPCGELLATVAADDQHSVRLWAWKTRRVGDCKPSAPLGTVGLKVRDAWGPRADHEHHAPAETRTTPAGQQMHAPGWYRSVGGLRRRFEGVGR